MKIALLNDIHVGGARTDSEVVAKHQARFFNEVFFPTLKKEGITKVVILGDVFERRKYINFKSLDFAYKNFFDVALEQGIDLDIFVGNHDVFSKDSNELNSPSLLLDKYKNIRLFDHTMPTEVQYGKGTWIGMIPWISENQTSAQGVFDFLKTTQCPVIFGHFDIIGFEMSPGAYCDVGLDASVFDRFDMVLTGHYHNKSTRGNIHYLGTQYDMDWNDYGQRKFFHIFDTATKELTPVENPIKLFIKLEYRNGIDEANMPNIAGKYVKLVVVEKNNAYNFEVCVNRLRGEHPESLVVVDLVQEEVKSIDSTEESLDLPTIIGKHVSAINQPDPFKASLNSLMTDLFKEASVS